MKTCCFGINGLHAIVNKNFTKAKNYIDRSGMNPKVFDVINFSNLVYRKEDLLVNKWLYIGDATEDEKKQTLNKLYLYKQIIMISQ